MMNNLNTVKTQINRFPVRPGGVTEYHATLQVQDGSLTFEEQLQAILEAYSAVSEGKNVLLRRFFLGDPASQAGRLEAALRGLPAAATSVIGQPPLNGTEIAAWVYAVEGGEVVDGVFSHNGYGHVWTGGMTSGNAGSEAQMAEIFEAYDASLAKRGMDVADNCVRTWIFVSDVDNNYGGVVKGRKDYFNTIGLTPDTHFIASTGIAGFNADPQQLVRMDAYAVRGLKDGQIQYLHAYDHLSPTAIYGVTFERGTAVTYGDRKHVFISGTASIDKEGKVLHVDDPEKQAERMLENVDALLKEAGAGFGDIAYTLVYLRNADDYLRVRKVIERECPMFDPIYVLAPVCRPTWLVEMECLAVTMDGDKTYKAL
jgi:enamine deaminase RidA (YjgF/YER057c/UK114 family)